MPTVSITHRTTYRYAEPVSFGEHRLMTRPRDSHDLRLVEATLAITPTAALRWKHDVFGNSVAIAAFAEPAATLEVVSRIRLAHFPADPPDVATLIEPYAETHPFAYPAEEAEDLAPVLRRHDPDPERLVDTWAKRFVQTAGPTRTADLLVAITRAIQAEFRYESRDAEGTNSPVTTLETGRGACRDLSLLMMEAVRSLGLAARFVTGYLCEAGGAGAVGGGATHAWVAVYVPGAGWVEYDPTNGLVAGQNLIRVGSTRTPEQAVPVGGGYIGEATDFEALAVDVTVQVGEDPPQQEVAPA
ncbi:MAG: transglutaminase N-terminal domain-containing protein [Elioraea tepidiphila]